MKSAVLLPAATGLCIGLGAFALYGATMVPDIGPVDSGELTLAAWELGVPHPPGFPLYVLVTHPFTLIPFGSVAERVNGASAFFAAAAVAGVFHLTWLALAAAPQPVTSLTRRPMRNRGASKPASRDRTPAPWPFIVGSAAAAVLFMSLRTPWSYATVAEVYALGICLTIGICQLMLRPTPSRMRAAALLFGLALGTHPPIVLVMLPALALLVAGTHRVRFFGSREFGVLFVLAVAGLAIYAYLPVAASRTPFLNWGNPSKLFR